MPKRLYYARPSQSSSVLATYALTAGWATFGIALPIGLATGALKVGALDTQTNVKTTYADGSIRYAILTAKVITPGDYDIVSSILLAGSLTPTWPSASVSLLIGSDTYVAALPSYSSANIWMNGPHLNDARVVVIPVNGITPHTFLRVIYDIRRYSDGGYRVDITCSNTLNTATADEVTYDVSISVGGSTVYTKSDALHCYLIRWRKVFTGGGLTESDVIPDFEPFYAANAIPRYLSSITNTVESPSGTVLLNPSPDPWDILEIGSLLSPMDTVGGRGELAPYPDWTVRFLIHKNLTQKSYVNKHGDLAASWGMHLTESDATSLFTIDNHPDFWLGRPEDFANGRVGLNGPQPDVAHQPSMAFIPYLMTGDRFYLEESKQWANYCLIGAFQDDNYNTRNHSVGLMWDAQVRGNAWPIRNISDISAYCPDDDPDGAYFHEKVQNNLDWYDDYATALANGTPFPVPGPSFLQEPGVAPLGTSWEGKRPEQDSVLAPYVGYWWMSQWEQDFLVWAIDRALSHGGYTGGTILRDRMARFALKLFTSEADGFPRIYGAPYVLAAGTLPGDGKYHHFTTMADLFAGSYQGIPPDTSPPGPVDFARFYGVNARLSLLLAIREGWTGAHDAYDFLMTEVTGGITLLTDLNGRAGWAIESLATS